MFTLGPGTALFLSALSLGMSLLLLLLLQLPGKSPGIGKMLIGLHLVSYIIAMAMDIPSHFDESTIVTRMFLGIIFLTGPTLYWMGRWGAGKKTATAINLTIYLTLFIVFEFSILKFPQLMFSGIYNGINLVDVIIFLWLISNAAAGLLILKGFNTRISRAANICILLLMAAGCVWGILTSIKNTLTGFTLGMTFIPVILLTAQSVFAVINRKSPDRKSMESLIEQYGLSPRESEVFAQLTTGAANKEIAAALGISENTVKRHINSLFRKCGVDSRFKLSSLCG